MFDFLFKKGPEEEYLKALTQSDGIWEISHGLFGFIEIKLITENEIFVFQREFSFGYNYFEVIKEHKREISKKFFYKIQKIADEYINRKQIEKVGGYIIDEDLQNAIIDTKKILGAKSQIELLSGMMEEIRQKYNK